MKLLVGAGTDRLEGFIHQDSNMYEGIDIICEFWDLPLNVYPRSCEEIMIKNPDYISKNLGDLLSIVLGLMRDGVVEIEKYPEILIIRLH